MKEFFNTLKRTEKVTRCNFYISVGYSIGGAILGVLLALHLLFKWGVKTHSGALIALISMIIVVIVYGFLIFPTEFRQALAMGKVRKYLFPANYLLWLRNTLVVLLVALGVGVLEEWMYSRLVAEAVSSFAIWSFLGNPLIFITILLCTPALILFLGGMILFFGAKVFWGAVGLYMICVGLAEFTESYPDSVVAEWLGVSGGEPNAVAICLLCLVGGAIMLGLSWLVLRKQRVSY